MRELQCSLSISLAFVSGIQFYAIVNTHCIFLTFCREWKFVQYRSSNVCDIFVSRVAVLGPASNNPFACKLDVSWLIFFSYEKN